MKAAVFNKYGATDVLEIVDIEKPSPKPDEALVQVRGASINPKDTFLRKGRFKHFSGSRFPMQTGLDFAGEVVDVGREVQTVKTGEAVFGMLDGWQGRACAEYVLTKPGQLAKKPEFLSFEEAAALPLVSLTALQALRDKGKIQKGMEVCINGASGGVGSMAVQIAKIHHATVTAVSSAANHELLIDLGADICIDYHDRAIKNSAQHFDIFFDVFGNQPFRIIKPILTKNGTWISTVIQPHVFISMFATALFSRKKAKMVMVHSCREDLSMVGNWVEAGSLKPVISKVFPLENIQEAHALLEAKHTRGKIVLSL